MRVVYRKRVAEEDIDELYERGYGQKRKGQERGENRYDK